MKSEGNKRENEQKEKKSKKLFQIRLSELEN